MPSLSLPAVLLRGPTGQNAMALPDRRVGALGRDFARVFAGFGTPDSRPELPQQETPETALTDTDFRNYDDSPGENGSAAPDPLKAAPALVPVLPTTVATTSPPPQGDEPEVRQSTMPAFADPNEAAGDRLGHAAMPSAATTVQGPDPVDTDVMRNRRSVLQRSAPPILANRQTDVLTDQNRAHVAAPFGESRQTSMPLTVADRTMPDAAQIAVRANPAGTGRGDQPGATVTGAMVTGASADPARFVPQMLSGDLATAKIERQPDPSTTAALPTAPAANPAALSGILPPQPARPTPAQMGTPRVDADTAAPADMAQSTNDAVHQEPDLSEPTRAIKADPRVMTAQGPESFERPRARGVADTVPQSATAVSGAATPQDAQPGATAFDAGVQVPLSPFAPLHATPPTRHAAALASQPTARHLAAQIVVAVTAIQHGTTEIALAPEELGRVRMQLTTTDQTLTVAIMVERPETADLMRRHIDTLVQELRDQGYRQVNIDIGGQSGQGAAQQKDAPPGNPGTRSRQSDPTTETVVPPAVRPALPGSSTLDLRL